MKRFKFFSKNIDSYFESLLLPIVRRSFGSLLSQDLVSIQPLESPSGILYYMDYEFKIKIKKFKFFKGYVEE